MSAPIDASAPGKLVLSGEYVVLQGGLALVAAVDRRAYLRWWARLGDRSGAERGVSPESAVLPPEVVVARTLAQARSRPIPAMATLDVTELVGSTGKYGLGSSAAGAAASVAAVFASNGIDLDARRDELFSIALEAHREVAPNGSGVDVAASVYGGVRRFRRTGDGVETHPVTWPASIVGSAIWSRASARTSELVAAVERLAEHAPQIHRARMRALSEAADQFALGFEAGDVDDTLAATRDLAAGMQALGEAACVPILTPALDEIAKLASECGGAAKPSGAGGGDVSIGFFRSPEDAALFESACREAGHVVLSLAFGAEGARAEARGS